MSRKRCSNAELSGSSSRPSAMHTNTYWFQSTLLRSPYALNSLANLVVDSTLKVISSVPVLTHRRRDWGGWPIGAGGAYASTRMRLFPEAEAAAAAAVKEDDARGPFWNWSSRAARSSSLPMRPPSTLRRSNESDMRKNVVRVDPVDAHKMATMAVVFAAVVGLGLVFTLLVANHMETARADREFEAALWGLKQVRLERVVDSPPTTTTTTTASPTLGRPIAATQSPTVRSTRRPTFRLTKRPTFATHGPTHTPTHQKLPTVHSEFALEVFSLAKNLPLPKLAVFNTKLYHYYGGKEQLKRYFKLRKWEVQFKALNASTMDATLAADLVITPCTSPLPPVLESSLISTTPVDYSVKQLLGEVGACHSNNNSEPWKLETINQCNETEPRNLFVKKKLASFAKHTFGKCDLLLAKRTTLFLFPFPSDGVQARAFLLVSSYSPLTVWFAMGYLFQGDKLVSARLVPLADKLKHQIKLATFAVFQTLLAQLQQQPPSRAFSLFNVDLAVMPGGERVKVVELGCNAELVNNIHVVGPVLVDETTKLVDGMMDLVLASQFASPEFDPLVKRFAQNQSDDIRAPSQSGSPSFPAWELLHLDGAFSFSKDPCVT